MDKLTNEMIKDLAIRLGLEPALLKAVQLVEAAGIPLRNEPAC